MKRKTTKKAPLWKSFMHAFSGIYIGIWKERNMRIHLLIAGLVIISGIIFKISLTEWFICIGLFGLVLSLELVNTAIETAIDICMPTLDERAKIAKDTAAGAVLIGAIVAAIIGLMIFIPKGVEVWAKWW